jgi:predicted  nucleic acid-binding Zn-ribbon protein
LYDALKDTLAAASSPVRIGEINQEATSESIISRGMGFIDKFSELAKNDGKKVAVTGHEYYTDHCKDPGNISDADIVIEVAELKSSIAGKKVEIETAKASVAKYKDQQDNVRNNREYDFLSKEIEFQTLEIELCEKRIKEFAAQEEEKSQEVAESTAALEERQKDLDVKKSELDEIISETKQEEEKLRDKAKELETKIEPRLLQSFKRIRKNSRNGLGIVYVQRDACGGCFNKIPPQRQLDIRSRKKIIVCEYCGRIMIDPELAGITPEQKVEVVKEKPVRAKRKIVHIGSDN